MDWVEVDRLGRPWVPVELNPKIEHAVEIAGLQHNGAYHTSRGKVVWISDVMMLRTAGEMAWNAALDFVAAECDKCGLTDLADEFRLAKE